MADRSMSTALMQKLRAFADAPKRFPVPLACAVLWAGITIARTHSLDLGSRPIVEQSQVFLLLGLFLSLSVKLFAESRYWSIARWLPLSAGALGLLALIVFVGPQTLDPFESPAFLFMGPGLILLTIVSPFLRPGVDNRQIWDFNFKSWTSAAFGLLVALVLAFGIVAAIAALEELFGLKIWDRLYVDVWIVCLSVIWPWQTLAGVPGGFGPAKEEYAPRWARYLIGWLLVPLAVLYLALLYAFAAKIAIQWTLPQGQIGWLVGGFAGFGLAVWHAADPLRETGGRLVRLYVRFFHPALLVPVALLATGVGARVAEYGVTENRYALILLALWLAGIAVHGMVVRAPRLDIAPISFAVLLVLASFGPWGASSVSIRSQLARLDALLTAAGVLRDGKLKPADGSVDRNLMQQISSLVDYLNDSNRRHALSDRLRDGAITLAANASSVDIVTTLGLEYINRWGNARSYSWSRSDPRDFDVRGFDGAIWINLGSSFRQGGAFESDAFEAPVQARIDHDILEISLGERGPVRIDLARIVETLKREGSAEFGAPVNVPLMTAQASGNGLKVRMHITSINAQSSAGVFEILHLSCIALIGLDEDG